MQLPSKPEDRKYLSEKVKEAVAYKRTSKINAQEIATIAGGVKEKTGISKRNFNKLVATKILSEDDPAKFQEERASSEALFENYEILFPKG